MYYDILSYFFAFVSTALSIYVAMFNYTEKSIVRGNKIKATTIQNIIKKLNKSGKILVFANISLILSLVFQILSKK